MIPDQTRSLTASFVHMKQNDRDVYQTDYLAKDAIVASRRPPRTGPVFAGAKVVQTIDAVGAKYKIDRFDLMIDWGSCFLSDRFSTSSTDLKRFVGNFRHRYSDRHGVGQGGALSAGQQILCFHEQDEEAATGDAEAQGALPRRPSEAAARHDGALQARKGLATVGLPAGRYPDSDFLFPLQGDSTRSACCAPFSSGWFTICRPDPTSFVSSASALHAATMLAMASGPCSWASPCGCRCASIRHRPIRCRRACSTGCR
jgi:hypothetical protein